jgi:hypothetical protein
MLAHRPLSSPHSQAALWQPKSKSLVLLGLVCALLRFCAFAADPDHCSVCGKGLGPTIYTAIDHVTHEKVFLCYACATYPDECYICGLPAVVNPVTLPDGRFLCVRDAKVAVLDESKAKAICEEVRDKIDRLFSRFLTLPSTNTTVALVDRVDLYEEFAVTGNNFECPDVLGYIRSQTNQTSMTHSISIMSALPEPEFRATCAHEYGHAWVFEHVSSARRKALNRDAQEGFCELIAWLLMDSLHEREQKAKMLRNTYTRGQIDLFIAAERTYGLNDILDWMRWGVNGRLKAADLGDVRNVEMPRAAKQPTVANTLAYVATQERAPDKLILKGISSARGRPLALINNQSIAPGESARVRVGTTNVLVLCLAIGKESVRLRLVGSGKEVELSLPARR